MLKGNAMYQMAKKTCAKCGKTHPASVEFFYRHPMTKGGYGSYCKSCCIEISKERYRKAKTGNPKRERVRWEEGMALLDEAEKIFEESGDYPSCYFQCRKCKKLKANTRSMFPNQRGAQGRDANGNKKLATVCRACRNSGRRARKVAPFQESNMGTGYEACEDAFGSSRAQIEDDFLNPPESAAPAGPDVHPGWF
jgi:hypothetical protein